MPAIFKKLFNRAGKSQVPMIQIPNLFHPPDDITRTQTWYLAFKSPLTAAGKIMKFFFLILFIVLGALDLLYGVLYKDQLSIVAGGAIVAITVYIWKKKSSHS